MLSVELVVLAGDSAERYHGLPVTSQGAPASVASPQGKADRTDGQQTLLRACYVLGLPFLMLKPP